MQKPDTRRILAEAFEELLKRNSYERISVADITAACGASRQTFYNYFRDKHDLAVWITGQDAGMLPEGVRERSFRQVEINFLRAMMRRSDFYRKTLPAEGQNSLFQVMLADGRAGCAALVERGMGHPMDPAQAFAVDGFVCALVMKRREWLMNGCPLPPETFCDYILQLLPADLRRYFSGEGKEMPHEEEQKEADPSGCSASDGADSGRVRRR